MSNNRVFEAKKDTSMKMQKRQFRIGELAKQLSVERFVIRFWEKEFEVRTRRSNGGQRCYTQEDVDKFTLIKELLYNRGFTIAGAKQQIDHKVVASPADKVIGSQKTTFDLPEENVEQITHKILQLQDKLKKLRALLDR
jgi:DNA-binding transcriptional MerR regulator